MARRQRLTVPCPICSGKDTVQELTLNQFNVLRCVSCGVQFSYPQPDDETLASIYSENYFLNDREGIPSSEVNRLKRETARLYVDKLLSIQNGNAGSRLLEIGCGTGDFLIEAQARGFEVSGLEVSAHAAAVANMRLGAAAVSHGHLESISMPEAAFDIIVFSDVVEHVRDPKLFLSLVHRCLRPGGSVFIVTPSTDSWSRKLMRRYWMEYKIEHLFYFNQRSLDLLLRQTGFRDIEFHRNVKVLSFEYVRAHFRRFPVPAWTPIVEAIGGMLPKIVVSRPVKVVASGMIAIAAKPLS